MSEKKRKAVTTKHDWKLDLEKNTMTKEEEAMMLQKVQAEAEKRALKEEAILANVSKLSYNRVNYALLSERVPWVEPQLPDFEPLLEEARLEVKRGYGNVLIKRIAVLVAGLLILPFVLGSYKILGILVFTLTMGVILFMALDGKQRALIDAEDRAKKEIQEKIATLKSFWQAQKEEHDKSESERIAFVAQVREGNLPALVRFINKRLLDLDLHIEILADLQIYADTPQVLFQLPSRSYIPMQRFVLNEENKKVPLSKEVSEINKEHLELCCAMMMRILATTMECGHVFERIYVNGVFDKHTYISVMADRDKIEEACNQPTGFAAISFLEGRFDLTDDGDMLEIAPIIVEEWEDVIDDKIKKFQIKTNKI